MARCHSSWSLRVRRERDAIGTWQRPLHGSRMGRHASVLNLLLHDLQVQVSDWEQLPSGEGRESDQEGEIENVQGWFVDCMREAHE